MSSGLSSKKEQAGHGSPFVSFRTVFNNYFLPNELEDKMDTSLSEQEIYSVKADDILLTRTSETIDELGMSCVVLNDVPNATYSGFTKRLRPKVKGVVYSKYIGFYLRTKMFRKTMTNNAFMTLRASLNDEIFSYLKLYLPDYQTQVKIGDFLYSLNQKIAINNKTNTELENMAKTIYDYWFSQFDFPDKNGHPYKTSGGQMVYNETLKREIPAGWTNCIFNDYVERITNGLNPRKNFVLGTGSNYYVTIRSLLDNDIDWDNCDKCDDVALSKINSRSQLQIGDVIFSAIGTIGRTYMIYEKPSDWNISETSFTIRPKKNVPQDFFYSLLRSPEFQKQADHIAMGSTLRCLVMDSFCEIPCILVPTSISEQYSKLVKPLYKTIYDNNKQNRELTKLRDYLLPLLMNGQIEVK